MNQDIGDAGKQHGRLPVRWCPIEEKDPAKIAAIKSGLALGVNLSDTRDGDDTSEDKHVDGNIFPTYGSTIEICPQCGFSLIGCKCEDDDLA